MEQKLEKIVSKEPSKFWEESNKRVKEKETLEEVALEFAKDHHEMYETSNLGSMHFGFCWGAKWQQEQMYSEEDMKKAFEDGKEDIDYCEVLGFVSKLTTEEWFEKIKKK